MYKISNSTTKNLRMARNVSNTGCLQSVLSIQALEFAAMLDQWVQDRTTHLDEKYERLSADYK